MPHTRKGLVHRDIKPGNVLLTIRDGEERAYLTDFGLAKRSDTLAELTVTGSLVGTADYMAPEQVTGDPADARSDIYALGCVFFQMLTGKVPYERETRWPRCSRTCTIHRPRSRLRSPTSYPEFTPVLERAMAKRAGRPLPVRRRSGPRRDGRAEGHPLQRRAVDGGDRRGEAGRASARRIDQPLHDCGVGRRPAVGQRRRARRMIATGFGRHAGRREHPPTRGAAQDR